MRKENRFPALLLVLALLLACAACGTAPAVPTASVSGNGDISVSPTPDRPAVTPVPTSTAAPETTASPSPAPTSAPTSAPKPTPEPTRPPVQTPAPTPTPDATPDLQAFFDAMDAAYSLGVSDMDAETLDAFYPGLTAIAAKQRLAKTAMISAAVSEIVLIECENPDDAETVKAIFAARKQAQADGGAWYPASMEQWSSAQIVSSGACVMLVAHGHAADIAQSFSALFQ